MNFLHGPIESIFKVGDKSVSMGGIETGRG